MKKKSSTFLVTILTATVVLVAAHLSGTIDVSEASGSACADDIAKFCQDRHTGKGAIPLCLREHEPQLSPACRDSLPRPKGGRGDLAQTCKADAEKYCKDIEPGGRRIVSCLREHKDDLSPACREKFSRMSQRPASGISVQ